MSRIPTPATVADAPTQSQGLLEGVQKQLGSVPNLFRLTANSPTALRGYLDLNGALSGGSLDPATRERIALAVAEYNGCEYCLAAHSFIAGKLVKLPADEIVAARHGRSSDHKANAAVSFAQRLVAERGHVGSADIDALKRAGYNDGEIVEIVAHVALNTLTNYINSALDTDVDFPRADTLAA